MTIQGGSEMKTTLVTKIAILVLLIVGLAANLGCDSIRGGAKVYLEGVTMSIGGKTISGLPSQKATVALNVPVNEVSISTTGEDTVIQLRPSGATIVIGPDGISLNGLDLDQIEMDWQGAE